MPFESTGMNLEIVILSEVSQEEKDKISYDIIYMWNLKNYTNELIYKIETDSQIWKTSLRLSQGKGRDKSGVWD